MPTAPLIAVGMIAALGTGISLFLDIDPLCGEELVSEQTSPDGRHVAALMIRNCGAMTDYVSHANVRPSSSAFHRGFFDGTIKDGEILTLEGDKRVPHCWLAAKRLNLAYPEARPSSQNRDARRDVDVTYGSECP